MDNELIKFLTEFLNSMLSEAGVLCVTLLLGGLYQTRQLNKANNDKQILNDKVFNLAISQVQSNAETNKILEKVVDFLPISRQGGNNDA